MGSFNFSMSNTAEKGKESKKKKGEREIMSKEMRAEEHTLREEARRAKKDLTEKGEVGIITEYEINASAKDGEKYVHGKSW